MTAGHHTHLKLAPPPRGSSPGGAHSSKDAHCAGLSPTATPTELWPVFCLHRFIWCPAAICCSPVSAPQSQSCQPVNSLDSLATCFPESHPHIPLSGMDSMTRAAFSWTCWPSGNCVKVPLHVVHLGTRLDPGQSLLGRGLDSSSPG